jgi:hypothetical protein
MKRKNDGSKGHLSQVTMTGWVSFEQQQKMKLWLVKKKLNFSDWLRSKIDGEIK